LHLQGVANRDLKLENLLLDQDQSSGNPLLKICDFGGWLQRQGLFGGGGWQGQRAGDWWVMVE